VSDIREWLFAPLKEQEQRMFRESGRRQHIEVTVDEHTFQQAVAAADIRFGVIATENLMPTAIYLGDFVVIKPEHP
jgi:hypothetical protein